jgi:hypothetical protein
MYAVDRQGAGLVRKSVSVKESMLCEEHPMREVPVQVAAEDAGE